MNCPLCDERLRNVEKAGITFALCPACKGAWMEREALTRLLGAAGPFEGRRDSEMDRETYRDRDDHHERHRDHDHEREHDRDGHGWLGGHGHGRRRGGFLESIGDLFGD